MACDSTWTVGALPESEHPSEHGYPVWEIWYCPRGCCFFMLLPEGLIMTDCEVARGAETVLSDWYWSRGADTILRVSPRGWYYVERLILCPRGRFLLVIYLLIYRFYLFQKEYHLISSLIYCFKWFYCLIWNCFVPLRVFILSAIIYNYYSLSRSTHITPCTMCADSGIAESAPERWFRLG